MNRREQSPLPMIAAAIGAVAALAVVIAAAFLLLGEKAQTFAPQDYVTLSDVGYDGSGTVEAVYKEDAIRRDLAPILQKKAQKNGFITESGTISYRDMMWQENANNAEEELAVCVSYLEKQIQVRIEGNQNLKNGDVMAVSYVCDNDRLKKYGLKASAKKESHTVQSLMNKFQVDPFMDLAVTFHGTSPLAGADPIPDRKEKGATIHYSVEPADGLKKGQSVTVRAEIISDTPDISLVKTEKEYKVEGVEAYTSSIQGIDKNALTKMQQTATSVFELNHVKNWPKDAELEGLHYCGMYFLRARDAGRVDVQNVAYLVYQVSVNWKKDGGNEKSSYYFYTSFTDLVNPTEDTCRVDVTKYKYPSLTASDTEDACYFETRGAKLAGYENLNEMYAACVTAKADKYLCDSNTPKPYVEDASEAKDASLAEESKKAAEESSRAEESRRAAEESSLAAAESSRAVESQKAAEESIRAEESRLAEESKKAAAESSRAEESKKAAESLKAAEESIKAAESSLAEERKKAEESKKAAEESSRAKESSLAEESRKAAEESSRAEESRKAAEESSRKAAEESSRKAAEEIVPPVPENPEQPSESEKPTEPEQPAEPPVPSDETETAETLPAPDETEQPESAEAAVPPVPEESTETPAPTDPVQLWMQNPPAAFTETLNAYRQSVRDARAPQNSQMTMGVSGDGLLAALGVTMTPEGFMDGSGQPLTTENLKALGLAWTMQDLNHDGIPELIVGNQNAQAAGSTQAPLQIFTLCLPDEAADAALQEQLNAQNAPAEEALPADIGTEEPQSEDTWTDEELPEAPAEDDELLEDDGLSEDMEENAEWAEEAQAEAGPEETWDTENWEESDPWGVEDPILTAQIRRLQQKLAEDPEKDITKIPGASRTELYCVGEGTTVSVLANGSLAAIGPDGTAAVYDWLPDGTFRAQEASQAAKTWQDGAKTALQLSTWRWEPLTAE